MQLFHSIRSVFGGVPRGATPSSIDDDGVVGQMAPDEKEALKEIIDEIGAPLPIEPEPEPDPLLLRHQEIVEGHASELAESLDRYRWHLGFNMIHNVAGIREKLPEARLISEVIASKTVQVPLEKLMVSLLSSSSEDDLNAGLELQLAVPLNHDAVRENTTIGRAVSRSVDDADIARAYDFRDTFRYGPDEFASIVRGRIEDWIEDGQPGRARRIIDAQIIPIAVGDPGIHRAAVARLNRALGSIRSEGEEKIARATIESLELATGEVSYLATRAYATHHLNHDTVSAKAVFEFGVEPKQAAALAALEGEYETARALFAGEGLELNFANICTHSPQNVQEALEIFQITDLAQLRKFSKISQDFFHLLFEDPEIPVAARGTDLRLAKALHITLRETEELKRNGVDLDRLVGDGDFKGLFEELSQHSYTWQDKTVVADPFQRAAETFGFREMFSYIHQKGLSRHDAVDGIEKVCQMVSKTDADPARFYQRILMQVKRDGAQYQEGSAHHRLIALANSFDCDLSETFTTAKEYHDLPELQRLMGGLRGPEDVFVSWDRLKNFSELQQLLKGTVILDQLKDLRELKPRKYNFISTLIFHPFSKVDLAPAIQIGRDPIGFLELTDFHVPDRIHRHKKPSNYVQIPHLDLSAEQLVDALIDGAMDRVQAHTPVVVEYEIPKGFRSVRESLEQALGSRQKNIPPLARNKKKLFHKAKQILKKDKLLNDGLEGGENPVLAYLGGAAATPDTEKQLLELVYDSPIGMHAERKKFIAQIHLKSDPLGILAGDDTSCCMRFGSGKNTSYMFNLNTSLFTVQMQLNDGRYRTLAQSVMTTDVDIGHPIPSVISLMNSDQSLLHRAIPESVLLGEKGYLTCDNIEVARNYMDGDHRYFIEVIYADFFSRYLAVLGKDQNLKEDELLIGKSFAGALTRVPSRKNTFAPLAPVSYSDNNGSEVYTLDVREREIAFAEKVGKRARRRFSPQVTSVRGLTELTYQDTLATAYLESRAYEDNHSLMEYLHNIENGLMAKDINNAAKKRPNLSLRYSDSTGRIWGYLIAYEGRLDYSAFGSPKGNGLLQVSNDSDLSDQSLFEGGDQSVTGSPGAERGARSGQPIVFIGDLASDSGSRLAGGKLIKGFMELYAKHYLAKGKWLPVFANLREKTSFKLVRSQLKRMAKQLSEATGVELDLQLEELEVERQGDERMHHVLIRPIRLK